MRVHSNESSSSEDIFYPTPSQPFTTNEEIGQSSHSPPIRSYVQTSSPVDVQQSVPNPNPVGQSTNNVGENIAEIVNENPSANADDHVEPTDNSAPDDGVPHGNVPPTEAKQPPAESRAKGKKSQQSRRNITKKTRRKKIPSNIPSVPINRILLHLEESVQR